MTTLKPVKAVQDNVGNWYLLPNELVNNFTLMTKSAFREGTQDKFEDFWQMYKVNIYEEQLYIER